MFIDQIDNSILLFFSSIKIGWLTNLAIAFYFLYYILFFLVPFFIYFYNKKFLKPLLFSIIIGFLIVFSLKFLIAKERPKTSVIEKFDYSFPSSHAFFSSLFFFFSFHLPIFPIVSIIFSFSIFSLLYLSLHYFSDIIFSIFLSFVLFKFSQKIFCKEEKKRRVKK